MAVWVVRAGANGEYEQKFFHDKRVYVNWENLNFDLSAFENKGDFAEQIRKNYPDEKPHAIYNYTGQLWPFAHVMKKGDLVVTPLKTQPAVAVAEISGDYQFQPKAPLPFRHWRPVKWLEDDIPRSHFGQDLLNSFGSFRTICGISRNNAEQRLDQMRANGWKPEARAALRLSSNVIAGDGEVEEELITPDLEEQGRDEIARLIHARFSRHNLTRLVDAILRAQGYTTYVSPSGPDGGVDILAGNGPLGFGSPRLAVEVKSEQNPVGREPVDKLLGAVTKFKANEGLFVSLSGFKANVLRELASSFFQVRLWSQKELFENLFAVYDKLDDDIKAELPLKRIWTVATPEEE